MRGVAVAYGLHRGGGQVWGRNDCCADSLRQLLIEHGVLLDQITAASRDVACLVDCRALWAAPDALKPKAYDGTPDWAAYLELAGTQSYSAALSGTLSQSCWEHACGRLRNCCVDNVRHGGCRRPPSISNVYVPRQEIRVSRGSCTFSTRRARG